MGSRFRESGIGGGDEVYAAEGRTEIPLFFLVDRTKGDLLSCWKHGALCVAEEGTHGVILFLEEKTWKKS